MPLDFAAVDFETAGPSSASACSVGVVTVEDGVVTDRVGWLIRPPAGHDVFSEWNIRIHGITPDRVVGAAEWASQLDDLLLAFGDLPVVAHNARFDMGVIRAACFATGTQTPALDYFCSLQIARSTYSLDSYRLPVAAMAAGFEDFPHHDALADAEACAAIVVHAARRHGASSVHELLAAVGSALTRLTPLDREPRPVVFA
ncbi:exonuclease domain-containing protein [Amnibacterium sp. CER49]|uniref:exonuclease domain-containing protein n=1 Tax=Amnibacterium sp. CER49 TaxID=3039161 RepID=UPI00244B9994|nr:exonuclease domain-containing protein [Amnibacterium sp. CER49]MDH2445362.1 exonuclease domain-containing protein [Amnibacterium sp. CER49]